MNDSEKDNKSGKQPNWLKVAIIPVLAAIIAAVGGYYALSAYVMSEAEENIQNILLSHRAVHQYIQQVLHPTFFRDRDKGEIPQEYYTPEIFSSSFIVRVMHTFHNEERVKAGLPEVYYKLASDNPRNPLNKADDFEIGLIRMFNEQRNMKQYRKVVTQDGKEYLYYAIPFLETSKACIRCHGSRSDAPTGLQRRYSGSGGFNEQTGRIRAIESIRAPINNEKSSLTIATSSISVFLIAGLTMFFFNRKLHYDVTERTEELEKEIIGHTLTEDALQESKNNISQLLEATDQGIYGIDLKGNCTFINKSGLHTLGYQADECIGRNMHDLIHHSHADGMPYLVEECPIFHAKSTGVGYRIDNEVLWRKEGTSFPAEYSSYPIIENGIIRGAVVTFTDISTRMQAEEEKARLKHQLQEAQKLESVGRLAGGVAHDFNNMLGVIIGYAELGLLHADKSNPLHAGLLEIRAAAERSADLTRQLLAFARQQAVVPKVLDLNESISGMLKMLQRLIGEDINLTWKPATTLWQVKLDPSQMDQILANLCVNARDAITDTGQITIKTENFAIDEDYCAAHFDAIAGEFVRLTISDDGSGIDKESLNHIFEPFYTTKELGKGTGLGLATVYGAVKQNSGFITVCSEPGQGTTFSIYLPRHVCSEELSRAETVTAQIARGQETILLVEDEPAILGIASMMLEKQGYTILKAGTPRDAMEQAEKCNGIIHLLMTDVIMPEMNGRDLANKLLSTYPQMKLLFMSGYTADVISRHGVLDEGVSFLQKPFSLPNLATKVREVLDK